MQKRRKGGGVKKSGFKFYQQEKKIFLLLQLVGNYFGYLRDKNINVTGGQEFAMEDNFVDTLYGTPVYLANQKQTKVRSNIFGFQVWAKLDKSGQVVKI